MDPLDACYLIERYLYILGDKTPKHLLDPLAWPDADLGESGASTISLAGKYPSPLVCKCLLIAA